MEDAHKENPFENLRVRYLFLWVAGGLAFYFSVAVLVKGFSPYAYGFGSQDVVVIFWSFCVFLPVPLWLWLDSGLAWEQHGSILGPFPKGRALRQAGLAALLAPLLFWGCTALERFFHMQAGAFFLPSVQDLTEAVLHIRKYASGGPVEVCLLGIMIILVGPIVEELVFRGILLNRWSVKWNGRRALLLSSLFFASYHTGRHASTFLFGVILALVYIQTKSLLVPLFCHILQNALAFTVSMVRWYGSPSLDELITKAPPKAESPGSVGLLIVAGVFFLTTGAWVFSLIYRYWPKKGDCRPVVVFDAEQEVEQT